jgi:hypothetical protein
VVVVVVVGRRARGPMKPFLQKKYSAKDHAHHMPHSFFSFLRGLMGKNWLHFIFLQVQILKYVRVLFL